MRVVFQSVVAMMLLGLLAPAHAASGPGLVFAVHPYDTPSRLVSRFQPLCDYLGAQLNRPVELYITTSYEDQVRKIAKDEVDIAYMGPSPYLLRKNTSTGTRDCASWPLPHHCRPWPSWPGRDWMRTR
ncbi:MAG: PhnD/SsuA/transferrin family substrate-binding protein [Xanthomonadaceae bacterium]|nr:PhnD/SsuA/transferrin family substrate-binding protein [Xanthomonadaceae bacterium]